MRIKLQPMPEQAAALSETMQLFTESFNSVASYGWGHGEKNGVRLHHATYRTLKAQHPTLVSDLHIQARVKATEAVKSALALQRKGRKVSCPRSSACAPRFNLHTFKLDWGAGTVRLSTVQGRTTLPFTLPAYAARYEGLPVATADLVRHGEDFWLHVVVNVPKPDVESTTDVVGVDLGLAQPAVTSNNRFLGKRRWRGIEARTFKLRRALQKAGTKSAKRHLRRLRGRQARFRRDCDHVLSKQVLQSVPEGGTVVLENLTNIRTRVKTHRGPQARRLHSWSFAQLKSFIEYKAEERGCTVAGVDPRHTSQACSRCGHVARNNRRSRAWFQCRSCGFQLHADLNGARNIAAKYLARDSISVPGGLPVNQPIVGGLCSHSSTHKLPALAGRS
ncbi:MAG: transposase [Chloroflexota bacterium]|nr:transposase [Chloroflexota bacterium]